MAEIKLTPEQLLATRRRSSLLVSAAAGSGKTRVLTQRLMAYINDEDAPCNIDDFLVITYTRAAAAELRARILEEISRLGYENPQNKRLRQQRSLCYQAKIGTIHSFCATILRENAHLLGISPDFSIGDEDKCRLLKDKALEKTLAAAYEKIAENPGFAALVESVGYGRDDSRLMRAILELHDKMQSHPYPEKWAQGLASPNGFASIDETPWGAELLKKAKSTASFWSRRLDALWYELCENLDENAPIITAYGESLNVSMEGLHMLSLALERGWDAARRELPIEFPRLKTLRNYEFDDRKNRFTAVRNACKKACEGLDTLFGSDSAALLRGLTQTAPAMGALVDLALEFDRVYAAEKRRFGLLDYSDLEHLTVGLLCDAETGQQTPLAAEISKRYREILIDEYQDVNAVQELILHSVSRNGTNTFMVGDVKQSIYRFRLADPNIFLEKLRCFTPASDAEPEAPATVLLRNNFRSDRQILSACNAVFTALMSRELGDIDYDSDSALYPPDDAPPPRGQAKISVICAAGDEDDERPDKSAIEAQFVAGQIKELVEGKKTVVEGGTQRPIRYGDIAILMRSPRGAGGVFKNVLAQNGIPVSANQGGGFFSAPEIVVTTALLTIIDNPHRDVPLAAALSSPVFGFDADELALARAFKPDTDFFGALCAFSEKNEKFREFLAVLNEFRALSHDLSVHELLSHLYERLQLPALWTAVYKSDDAATRLMMLSELAAQSENGLWRSLAEFLTRLDTMRQRGQEPQMADSGGHDTVNIMSIHKSKGLEFPVVFLCDTARKFNKSDLNSPVLVHADLGIGGKVTDAERGIEFPTASHRAIRARLEAEMLSEEMRVLYVALTRAKEKLFVTCSVSEPEKFIETLKSAMSLPPDPEFLQGHTSMAHWLVTAALADNTGVLELEAVYPEAEIEANLQETTTCETAIDTAELQNVRKMLDFRYPFAHAANLPSKITATALSDAEQDGEAAPIIAFSDRSFELPQLGIERALSGAEKGVATHTVMQFIDFSRTGNLDEIESEIARIKALGQLDARQAKAVDRHAILRFFASEIGQRLLGADAVFREFRFSLLVPADTFFENGGDEALLLQGIVDCCIEENGTLTVVDYKTDFVTPETLGEKARHYAPQLRAYSLAMERITGKKVAGSVLCFLRSGLTVEV